MNYTGITFEGLTQDQIDLLIAVLPEYGFHGMEETSNGLKAYATESNVDFTELIAFTDNLQLQFSTQLIQEENWNKTWESNFAPVIIPGRIQVRAHFHEPANDVEHHILITPKMSFGTGHHPTTKMMMLAMLETEFKGKTVIDFGTGTGILAILAIQLGAAAVSALDNDDWSIENVKENIALNGAVGIAVQKAENLSSLEEADIVLANINKHILIEHAVGIRSKTKQHGILIISGLLRTDYEDIINVYSPLFGNNYQSLEEGDWLALVFKP